MIGMQSGRVIRGAAAAAVLILAVACGDDAVQRQRILEGVPAQHLVGVWDIALRLERPITIALGQTDLPRTILGTVMFLETRYEQLSYPQMDSPTHVGVYDLNIRELGFPQEAGSIPLVIARTVGDARTLPGALNADSLYIVFNPGTSRYTMFLSGRFSGDSIIGTWAVESFLGGGGEFVLRRHALR
jgi:hypothetical protein